MNGLIIYTVGVLLVGLGFGFCWGWADGRRRLRAELDKLYRERIAPKYDMPIAAFDTADEARNFITRVGRVNFDEDPLWIVRDNTVTVGQPLYDQEQEH